MILKNKIFALLTVTLFFGFIIPDKKGETLVKNIQKKYNNYKDIQVEFTQKTISEFKVWAEKRSLLIVKVKTLDLNENESIYILKKFAGDQNLEASFFTVDPGSVDEIIDMRVN